MNRAYKLVWNSVSNSWIVASELAKGAKKSSAKTLKLALLLAAGFTAGVACAAPAANTLPAGESVASGSASFDRSVANQLTVNQASSKLITNWNSFDVGSSGKVIFDQPNGSSIALNRVTGGSASEIYGQVTANGQLVLVNPNGITFGAGSQVSASSIIGSVLDIQDSDFNAGNLLFSRGAATGSIDNQGSLSLTTTTGSVTLLAPTVKNSGRITVAGGNASLINADAVDVTTIDPAISTASSIAGLIQNTGNITATQVSNVGGKIILTGDTSQTSSQIQLAGTLEASNTNINGRSILINGDVNLNGAANTLDLTSTAGYSLTNAAAVNLNGASSGFSVNGTAYTVVRDVNQLQAMNDNKAGNYVLGADIDASDTVNWNSGEGFVPIGGNRPLNGGEYVLFTGSLHGLGHRIDALSMNRPGYWGVGLIGYAQGITVRDIGLTNISLQAGWSSAPLVGYLNYNNVTNTIFNVYTTGTFNVPNTARGFFGGLIGVVGSTNSGGTVLSLSNSYSTVNINATTMQNGYVGGLIGGFGSRGSSTISNVYYSGAINTQTSNVGGVLGGIYNDEQLSLNNAYASGTVLGSSTVGGIVGRGFSTLTLNNSYWNTETTGQAIAIGNNSGTKNQVTGLTTAQSTQLSSYANWGSAIDAQGGTGSVWRIYEGHTGPLLRSFLKTLDVTMGDVSKTYDGTTYSSIQYQTSATADSTKILQYFAGARNAGTYALGDALYSTQDGYDLNISGGTLTINKRLLTITATDASKEYDGKLTSSDKPVVTGRQRGDAIVGLTQSYLDKNAGTGKTINVDAGFTIRDGNNGNNYDVVIVNSNAGVITPKALTISTVANTKVYDGGVTSANKPVVTGLISGDRVTGLFQQYETKTVGTGKKLIVKSGYVVNDGNGGNNYTVTEQGSTDGVITVN